MATYDAIMDMMRPQLPGCPDVTLKWAALLKAREFCTESRAYRGFVGVDTADTYSTYTLQSPVANAEVLGVMAVQVCGNPYAPMASEDAPCQGRYEFFPLDTLRLFPTPDTSEVGAIQVRVVLQPIEGATALPDGLSERFARQISFGALSLIKMTQDQPWTDPQGAALKYREFQDAIVTERVRADYENSPRARRTRMHT